MEPIPGSIDRRVVGEITAKGKYALRDLEKAVQEEEVEGL